MIRWIDHYGRQWITRQDIRERQKNTGRRVHVLWLKQNHTGQPAIELVPDVMLMVPGCDHDHAFPWGQSGRTIERVLEHRAGADEGAVLLRFLIAEPTLDEFLGPHPVTTGQHNRPHVPSCLSVLHVILPSRPSVPIRVIFVVVVPASWFNRPILVEYRGRT